MMPYWPFQQVEAEHPRALVALAAPRHSFRGCG